MFEGGEVGVGIATEPGSQGPGVTSSFEALTEFGPSLSVDASQLSGIGRTQAGGRGRDQANLAAEHGGRRGGLAAGGASLVVALRAEQLLEVVVGPRQARHAVAVEQSGPVAAEHLGEVLNGRGQTAGAIAVPAHGRDQAIEPPADGCGSLATSIAQQPCRGVHPGVGAFHIRPERGRAFQAAADQPAKPRERGRGGTAPFCRTRSRLSATASSRPLSLSPGAESGVRPSSVMALRTAAQ